MANSSIISNQWEIGLFDCGGDCSNCVYACCFPGCALASAKSNLDGSDWLFNLCFYSGCVSTFLIKSAYGIEQNLLMDILYLWCLSPCYANQILQTSLKRRNPTTDGGLGKNLNRMVRAENKCLEKKSKVCYSCMCPCVSTADELHHHIGLPWIYGCLCVGPVAGYQLLRYQHRFQGIDGDEFIWALLYPSCFLCIQPILSMRETYLTSEVEKLNLTFPQRYLVRSDADEARYAAEKGGLVVASMPPQFEAPIAAAVYVQPNQHGVVGAPNAIHPYTPGPNENI